MRHRQFLHLLMILFLLLTGAAGANAQNHWDGVLDRYDDICERCIRLRQHVAEGMLVPERSISALLQELATLRKTLREASGAMTSAQRARFRAIQQRYAEAAGISRPAGTPKKATRPDSAPLPSEPPARNPVPVIRDTLILPTVDGSPVRAIPLQDLSLPEPAWDPDIEATCTVPVTRFRPISILATYAHGTDSSFGLMAAVGLRPHWGAWVAGRSNFTPTGGSYTCFSDGRTGSGMFWGNGQSRYGILSLSGGAVWKPLPWLGVYAGPGFCREELDWQDAEGNWARVQDYSFAGLSAEGGLLLQWRHIAFSAGCSWHSFATLTLGIGVSF